MTSVKCIVYFDITSRPSIQLTQLLPVHIHTGVQVGCGITCHEYGEETCVLHGIGVCDVAQLEIQLEALVALIPPQL